MAPRTRSTNKRGGDESLVLEKEPAKRSKPIPRTSANVKEVTPKDDERTEQYWLLKAEPESRIERGVDVKFSIDDLAAAQEPEAWDGVRNYVARNNMRAMKKEDLAFFYHSNCKVPGIVGVMKIVEEASVDESALDPKHPYFDAKSSSEKPKWSKVKVSFVRKFDRIISLAELKSYMHGESLSTMQTLTGARLSVSRVTPGEWAFINELEKTKPSSPAS